jgi:hypothetical protein
LSKHDPICLDFPDNLQFVPGAIAANGPGPHSSEQILIEKQHISARRFQAGKPKEEERRRERQRRLRRREKKGRGEVEET